MRFEERGKEVIAAAAPACLEKEIDLRSGSKK